MKILLRIALWLWIMIAWEWILGQEINIPHPNTEIKQFLIAKSRPSFTRQNLVDLTALAAIYAMDAQNTLQMLAGGNRELILPSSVAQSHAGMWALGSAKFVGHITLTRMLNKHGHTKLALWSERIDIGASAPFVIHNYYLSDNRKGKK